MATIANFYQDPFGAPSVAEESNAPGLKTQIMHYLNDLGQGIIRGHERNQQLHQQAFSNRERPFQVTDTKALGELGSRFLDVTNFAPTGIFIGPNSKLWNASMVREALELEKKGVGPEEIWEKTGSIRGVDGNWRQEIGDQDARILTRPTIGMRTQHKLSEVMDHPRLYEAYPSLKQSELVYPFGGQEWGGAYNREHDKFFINPYVYRTNMARSDESIRDTLLHEIQHAIQARELGWRGGSSHARARTLAAMIKGVDEKKIRQGEVSRLYRLNAGEVEARLAAKRKDLTEIQRKKAFPYKKGARGIDVKLEDAKNFYEQYKNLDID